MKAYLVTSGSLFALLALVHVWRLAEEGWGPAGNPWFVATTPVAAALSVWAFRLVGRRRSQ